MKRGLVLIALLLGMTAPRAHAFLADHLFLPPTDGYQRLETEHFKVIFPKDYETEALSVSGILEDAHSTLAKAFRYEPGHKCTFILTDNEDFANGVTSAVGRQGIVLFLTSPDPYTSIGEYDHWLRNLVIHEYAHYLTLEQTRGIFKFTRYLFGDLIFPNHLWPSWLAEGLAVYAESKYTKSGRGHGTYYNTLTRDAIYRGLMAPDGADDDEGHRGFLHFNQLSGPIPDFPFGEGAYYAGYAMIDEMTNELGPNAPAKFAEASSWRFPFFLNGTLTNIGGIRTFHEMYDAWAFREKQRMKPELDWLKKNGVADPEFLSPEKVSALGARLSPDETRLAYVLHSGHERTSIQLVDLKTKETRKLDDAISGGSIAWSADGQTLYYGKADFRGPFSFYSDIYSWRDGSITRVTKDARAKDPGFCTPGTLVYSHQRGRVSEIRAVELATGAIRTIYRAPEHHHVSVPRCTLDGKSVIFGKHGTDPLEAIYSAPLHGAGDAKHLFGGHADGFGALFPEPDANGDVYFTLMRDGFYDLARWDATTGRVHAVARSSGGYWLPSLGSGANPRMAVSYLSATGIRAALIEPRQLEASHSSAIVKAPVARKTERVEPVATPPTAKLESRSSYNLFTSLRPRLWAPLIAVGDAQTQIGGTILGWDDLDIFEYTFFAWYDTIPKKPEGIFSTFYRFASLRLGLSASSQITDYLLSDSGDRRIYDEERKLTATLSRPFPGAFSRFTPTVRAEWARTFRDGDFGRRVFAPDQRVGLDLAYDSRQRYSYSVFPERGTLLRLEGLQFFSGDERAAKALANWEQLFAFPPRHGNLRFNLYGVVAPFPQAAIPASNIRVGGKGTLSDLDPPLRGYPLGNFDTRRAGIIQAEYRFPIAQLFTGFETWPIFLQNLGGYAFYDAAKLQRADEVYGPLLSGVGAGLTLQTQLGYGLAPLTIKVEFAHGLKKSFGGEEIFSFDIGI